MRRVAPVLALLLLAAVSACTSESKEAGHTTLTVLLNEDVTEARKGAVEQRLHTMPSVEDGVEAVRLVPVVML